MIYAMPIIKNGLSCVDICEGEEPFPVEAVYPIIEGLEGYQMIIENGVLREKTTEEKAQWQAVLDQQVIDAEIAFQLAKSIQLKSSENQFLLFCDQVTGTTGHAKLSIPQLNEIGNTITDPSVKLSLMVQLLALDAQCKTYGGLGWWDSCTWHEDIVTP